MLFRYSSAGCLETAGVAGQWWIQEECCVASWGELLCGLCQQNLKMIHACDHTMHDMNW